MVRQLVRGRCSSVTFINPRRVATCVPQDSCLRLLPLFAPCISCLLGIRREQAEVEGHHCRNWAKQENVCSRYFISQVAYLPIYFYFVRGVSEMGIVILVSCNNFIFKFLLTQFSLFIYFV